MTPTDIAEGTYVLPKKKHDPVPTEPHPVETTLTEETPKNVTSAQPA